MSASVIWKGPTDQLVEQPDSPEFEFAEKAVCTRTYRGLYSLARSSAVPKGALGTGTMLGYKVASCKVNRERGGVGKLTIAFEAYSVISGEQLPPDDIDVSPLEVNPRVESNPFFANLKPEDLDQVRAAYSAQTVAARSALIQLASNILLAKKLLEKLSRGTENYYLAGFTYKWTAAYWDAPALSRGGFIQFPGGPLSGVIPTDMTYLRQADALTFTGVYFRYTQSWVGTPVNGGNVYWDPDLYQ